MSLTVSNIALHFISKNEATGESVLRLSSDVTKITPKIESFIDSLHKTYNSKSNKAYGAFSPVSQGSDNPSFQVLLQDYQDESSDFLSFSAQAAKLLNTEIEKYDMVESGYLVMCHYEYMGGRFLLVAIIPVLKHYSVDGQLNISADEHLDTSKLQLAARIDLFDQVQNKDSKRYISFIKGRAGRKVSDFFLDFLGCEEGLNAKEQTQTLVKAVEDFVSVNEYDANEKQETRKAVLSYCKEQKGASENISLQGLSETLNSESEGKDFVTFCKEQSYPLEAEFPHDQTVINKVTKYSGYGDGISLSFERNHLGTNIIYNPNNDTITIHKVPPNLKVQLLSLLEGDNQ
jgi:nucleoid-associated protein